MRTSRPRPFLLFILLLMLTLVAYQPGLLGDYVFDDMQNLLLNTRLDMESLDVTSLKSASLSAGPGIFKRPVSMLSFALNRYVTGIDPFYHKVVNLAIHLLTGVALLLLTRRIMQAHRQWHEPELPPAADTWLPILVCGAWLLHPLNMTSVLYIVQRMTSLSALFTVCGLYCYVRGRQQQLAGSAGWAWILSGLLIFGSLAFLSKENGALLPLYMLVIELVLFRFRNRSQGLYSGIAVFFTLSLLIPALGVLILLAGAPDVLLGGYTGRDFSLSERILTEMRVLVFYLKLLLAPSISDLGLYHDDIRLSRNLLDPATTLYSLLALAGLLVAALLFIRKLPLLSLGILWFFAGHVMESTILPLEIAHEHRNYLAGFGILLAVGASLAYLPGHRVAPLIRTITPGLLITLLAYTTWVRAGQWSDNITHATFEAMHHPQSPRAIYSAGRIHARLALVGVEASTDKAFAYLQAASRLDSTGIMPDVTMIKLASILQLPVQDTWYDTILTKLEYPVSSADVTALHALALCQETACDTPPETMETIFQTALNNNLLRGPNSWANIYTSYGQYQINVKQNHIAGINYFTKAVEANPREAQYWINLIKLLVVAQEYEAAEDWLERFQEANTHGGTERDFTTMRRAIDEARSGRIRAATSNATNTTR